MNLILGDPVILAGVIWFGFSFIGSALILIGEKGLWNEWECFGPGLEMMGMIIGGPITFVLGIIALLKPKRNGGGFPVW